MGSGIGRTVKFFAVTLALGAVAVIPGKSAILDAGDLSGRDDGPVDVAGPVDDGPVDPTQPDVGGPVNPNNPTQPVDDGLQCTRSKNGGATDVGVTATTIRLASTMVKTGPGASFLADSPTAMQAVVRKVNAAGGICGRLLDLKLRDDAWDANRGLNFLKAFIKEGVFALPVVPSSEGLTAAVEAGEIKRGGIPVIGSDGMLKQQYADPWVWPVATATISTMRIMAKYGYDEGARCFGIVWDQRFKFGREGAEAFRNFVKTLKGARVCADVGIFPERASYSSEIQQFNKQCDGKCEFVAWLLEPGTALTWVAGRPQMGTMFTSGAQTLFNQNFAANCGAPCAGMLVWTGYNPPIGNLAGLPDVAEYVSDVRTIDPKVDVTNQFMEGAYLGMKIFVEALKEVGPNLTRARLQQVMNSESFKTDIASKLGWTANDRFANKRAQAFSIVVAQGSFAGFRNEQTGFIADPTL